jgi:hypothetical protein
MRYVADPAADEAVALIVGPWQTMSPDAPADALRAAHGQAWRRLTQATRLLEQLGDNASLADWSPQVDDRIDSDVARIVESYVREQQALPAWAKPELLERAEALFMDHGPLSCILLFCASLPE